MKEIICQPVVSWELELIMHTFLEPSILDYCLLSANAWYYKLLPQLLLMIYQDTFSFPLVTAD